MRVEESAIRDIVRYYTREAGVRSLERELSKICRKVVKGLQLKKLEPTVVVTADNLPDYLGVRKYSYGRAEHNNQVGQVVGLAWTEVGGDLLTIEAAIMPGKGVIARACWASRTRPSRRRTSTCTCPMAPRPRTARARVLP
jgi:ATP-dependent Lon protease